MSEPNSDLYILTLERRNSELTAERDALLLALDRAKLGNECVARERDKLTARIAEMEEAKGGFVRRLANNIRAWQSQSTQAGKPPERTLEEVILASDVGAIIGGDKVADQIEKLKAALAHAAEVKDQA